MAWRVERKGPELLAKWEQEFDGTREAAGRYYGYCKADLKCGGVRLVDDTDTMIAEIWQI